MSAESLGFREDQFVRLPLNFGEEKTVERGDQPHVERRGLVRLSPRRRRLGLNPVDCVRQKKAAAFGRTQ